jgi:hypothetical protein
MNHTVPGSNIPNVLYMCTWEKLCNSKYSLTGCVLCTYSLFSLCIMRPEAKVMKVYSFDLAFKTGFCRNYLAK